MKNVPNERCDDGPTDAELVEFISTCERQADLVAVEKHIDACPCCRDRATRIRNAIRSRSLTKTETISRKLADCDFDLACVRESNLEAQNEANGSVEFGNNFSLRFDQRGLLGRGGYGAVYRMFDKKLGREVAVKIPFLKVDGDARARRRFEREVEATARLRHANIVPLHDFILNDVDSVLIHELVEGKTLADWILEHPAGLEFDQAAQIALRTAHALHHAHEHGIIHRDVKPSNILLDMQRLDEGLPFTPRLADFGVAKILRDETISESHHQFIGTVHYSAPEVVLSSEEQTPASDVYSLGAVLYEMLTGQKAFEGATVGDLLGRIGRGEFAMPRKLRTNIPRDLEAICLRCLSTKPEHRYFSANAFASDLRRYLLRQPVQARRPNSVELTGRWLRRHPTQTAVGVLSAIALTAVLTLQAINRRQLEGLNLTLENQNQLLSDALRESNQSLYHNEQATYVEHIRTALSRIESGNLRDARTLLALYEDGKRLQRHRDFDWYFCKNLTHRDNERVWKGAKPIYCCKLFDNALAVAGAESTISIIDLATGSLKSEWQTGQIEINCLAIDASNDRIYSSGDDGTIAAYKSTDGTLLWKHRLFSNAKAYDLAVSQSKKFLVCVSNEWTVGAIDISGTTPVDAWMTQPMMANSIAIRDDKEVLVGSKNGELIFLDLKDGDLRKKHVVNPRHRINSLVFNHDSSQVCVGVDYGITGIDLETLDVAYQFETSDEVVSVHRAPSINHYTVVMQGGVFQTVEFDDDNKVVDTERWSNDGTRIYSALYLKDQDVVLTVDHGGEVLKWKGPEPAKTVIGGSERLNFKSCSLQESFPDRWPTLLAATQRAVHAVDVETSKSKQILKTSDEVTGVYTISNKQCLVGFAEKNAVVLSHQEPKTGSPTTNKARTLEGIAYGGAAFLAGGQFVAGCDTINQKVWFQDLRQPQSHREFSSHGPRFLLLADDLNQAFWSDANELRVLSLEGKKVPKTLATFPRQIERIAISMDRRTLAIGLQEREVQLWDLESSKIIEPSLIHAEPPVFFCFSAFDQSVLSIDRSGMFRCWNRQTGLQSLEKQLDVGAEVDQVVMSNDNRFTCLLTRDGKIHVYRLY